MKNIFLTILLVMCGVMYGQTETVYTAKELEQKLENQKTELKKENIDDKIAAQDKRIDEAQDYLSDSISLINIGAAFLVAATAFGGYLINRSNRKTTKEVKLEIERLKTDTNEEVERIWDNADLILKNARLEMNEKIKEIESLLEKAKEHVDNIESFESNAKTLVEKIQSNKEGEDSKEIKEETKRTVEEIDEKLPVGQYTFDDWFLKGYDAREKGRYEDAAFYYRKATESADFESKNIRDRGTTYNNWGFALFDLAKLRGTINEDQQVIKDKWLKAYELKNPACLYNLTRLYSLLDERDEAFRWFEESLQKLWKNETVQERINSDPDIDNLRQDPRFEELLNKYRSLNNEG